MSPADPKPAKKKGNAPRRIVDPAAVRRALLRYPECCACGARAANGHHVIGKGQLGDDVPGNIVSLCGSGTMGCHGSLHGNTYVLSREERRDAEWVRRRIGVHITKRQDIVEYVTDKLGHEPGLDYLARTYYLERTS